MANHPLLLGHRGTRGEKSAPENTIAAFDLAIASGCDGFEFDVRRTVDGQAVICHDKDFRRREIAQYSAGSLDLLLLRDVLRRYQRTAFLDIELKETGLEKITVELLKDIPPHKDFVVSSFLPEVLQEVYRTDPNVPLGLICETRQQMGRWPHLPADYVISHFALLPGSAVSELKSAGKKVLVWTVNVAEDIKRFASMQVDGIISDNPRRLVRNLRRSDAQTKSEE